MICRGSKPNIIVVLGDCGGFCKTKNIDFLSGIVMSELNSIDAKLG